MFANHLFVVAALVAGTALTTTARAAEFGADPEIAGLAMIEHPIADDSAVLERQPEARGREAQARGRANETTHNRRRGGR